MPLLFLHKLKLLHLFWRVYKFVYKYMDCYQIIPIINIMNGPFVDNCLHTIKIHDNNFGPTFLDSDSPIAFAIWHCFTCTRVFSTNIPLSCLGSGEYCVMISGYTCILIISHIAWSKVLSVSRTAIPITSHQGFYVVAILLLGALRMFLEMLVQVDTWCNDAWRL